MPDVPDDYFGNYLQPGKNLPELLHPAGGRIIMLHYGWVGNFGFHNRCIWGIFLIP